MAYSPELLDRLELLIRPAYTCTAYRHMFARLPPTIENVRGARWNPRDTAAIYTSLERDTVLAEIEYRIGLEPLKPTKGRTLYQLEVHLAAVVDLRSSDHLEELGILQSQFADPASYRRCQEIGGAVALLECSGLLVPSARLVGGSNLVIYPTVFRPDDGFEVTSIEDLMVLPK